MARIELHNVTKRWGGYYAVEHLDMVIEDNAFVTPLGPSGCGKTTARRMIAGLETPTEGLITIDGVPMFDSERGINVPPNKRRVGFLFQNYALWPNMTVYQNIAFGLSNINESGASVNENGEVVRDETGKAPARKLTKEEIKRAVDRVSAIVKIGQFMDRYPSELSGGQQQRVAIARTLAPGPKVLFMDEPLSNLDAKLRMEMRAELKRLHRDTDSTFVYVTHDQLEAMTLSTRVCIMETGVLQQFAPPLEMYNNPANVFVADFMGNPTINFIDGTAEVDGNSAKVTFGKTTATFQAEKPIALSGKEIVLGVRPEHIHIHEGGKQSAVVYSTLPTGMETTVKLDVDGMMLTAVVFGDVDYPIDTRASFDFSKTAVLFDKATGKNVARGTLAV